MNISEPFVLKRDVLLTPCAELSDDVRKRISFDEGDFTLSYRHGRAAVRIIDGQTAALLELFREPRTIVDAVIENSRSLGKNPHRWLDELLPQFATLVDNRVLVPAGDEGGKEIRPRYESGAAIAGWEIVRCASLIEDTEIYQLRRGSDLAALKIARFATPGLRSVFANEIAILDHLDGSGIAPRLLEAGVQEERPYAIIDWVEGVEAGVAAAQRRHDRASLIDLCASIAAAYTALHGRGILHVDVHARNVIIGSQVTLLDFGYSQMIGRPPRVDRAGMLYYYEPEMLAAQRLGTSLPPSLAGEQYSIGALLYLLIAGHFYLDFRYEREEMMRQVEDDPPSPFAERGVPPWPEVERVLFRALEKDPSRRFGSTAEMAAVLADVRETTVRESLATPLSREASVLLDTMLQSFSRGGTVFATRFPTPPTASINFGCAGAAVGLLRIAETRGDAALLALADVWRSRAASLIGSEGAYYNPGRKLGRKLLGDVTPYHTESGIHAAAAMVAAAMGDTSSHRRAIGMFLAASNRPCVRLDVTLGRSGSLLATAMLLEISKNRSDAGALRTFGAETMSSIWNELDAHPPIEASPNDTYLGIAHGWAGYLYAALRWCAASGDPLPPRLAERLHEYAALKQDKGRGAYWRSVINRPRDMMPGWCNGSAGQVFLFTLVHRFFDDDQWLRLAELCAWTTWDEPHLSAHLCCGTAGRAYALLNLYKHTGATEWLSRARQLANHAAANAASTAQWANSLWRGELGVAVLIADLASPENARMPFFE